MATIFLPVLSFMVPMLLSALVIAFCIWRTKRAGGRSPINTKSEKITCTFAKRAVSCAPSPRCPRRNFTKKPHDHVRPTKHRRLPQRRAANARCGSVCALRVRRTRHHRLTGPINGRSVTRSSEETRMPSDAVPGAFFCAFAQEFHQIRAAPIVAVRNKIAASQEAAMRRSFRLATAVRIPIRPVRAAVPLRMPMPARVGSTIG